MGTSSSSGGPGGGIPMVPPWADNPPGGRDGEDNSGGENNNDTDQVSPKAPPSLAPKSRFGGARKSMGTFAGSGSRSDMQRGVGRYVSKGYGGAKTATRRFSGTANTAASLAGILSSESRSATNGIKVDSALTQGKSANEIMDVIVDAVSPINGTQDNEVARESIKDALSELLDKKPNVDLLELDDISRDVVIESFIASNVYRRIFLDIGKHIQDKAPNAITGVQRLRQIKDYVRETVKDAISKLKSDGKTFSNDRIASISGQALLETFQVFEEYAI